MRRPHRQSFSAIWHTLTVAIKALQQQHLVRSHVLLVVEFMIVAWCDCHGLASDLVAVSGVIVLWIRNLLLSAIVYISRVCSLWIEQVCCNKIFGRGAAPVYDCKGMVGRRVLNGTPDVDDLIAALDQLVGFFLGQVPSDTGFCSTWSLVHMYLLDGLAWRVLDPSSYGMVEDDYFLHAREFVAEKVLNFGIVASSDSSVVGEEFFACRILVDSKAGIVRVEVLFASSEIVDWAVMALPSEVVPWSVNLGPWFALIGGSIDVDKACGSHPVCCAL